MGKNEGGKAGEGKLQLSLTTTQRQPVGGGCWKDFFIFRNTGLFLELQNEKKKKKKKELESHSTALKKNLFDVYMFLLLYSLPTNSFTQI